MNVLRACGNCKFWQETREGAEEGQCRTEAPKMFAVPGKFGLQFMSTWPASKRNDWCAKFEPEYLGGPPLSGEGKIKLEGGH